MKCFTQRRQDAKKNFHRNIKPILQTFLLLAWCSMLHGCIAINWYDPVQITVRDAETGTPISDATVKVHYLYAYLLNHPKDAETATDFDGKATLDVVTFTTHDALLEGVSVTAKGYRIESAPGPLRVPRKEMVFNLYRLPLPPPQIIIVVPNHYRGLLMIDRRPVKEWTQEKIGQRDSTFHASTSGYVGIDSSPLLFDRDFDNRIRVVDENGKWILHMSSKYGNDHLVALRDIGSTDFPGRRHLYVIGTKSDADSVIANVYKTQVEDGRKTRIFDEKAFNALFDRQRETKTGDGNE